MKKFLTIGLLCITFGFGLNAQKPIVLNKEIEEFLPEHKTDKRKSNNPFAVFMDPENNLTVEQIAKLDDHFFDNTHPLFNFEKNVSYWIKLKIKTSKDVPRKWVFEIMDSRHNEVAFYAPNKDGKYVKQTSGIELPFDTRKYGHKNFIFDLPVVPDTTLDYYVKIKSNVVGSLLFKIHTNHHFSSYAFDEYYLLGVYYGILFIIAFYNLFLYFSIREKVYLYYIFYVLSWAFFSMLDDGIGYQYIWPNTPEISSIGFYIGMPMLMTFFVLYSRSFLDIAKHYRFYDKLILGAISLYLAFHFLGSSIEFDILYNILFLVPFLIIYYVTILSYKKGYKPSRFLIIGNTFIILGIIIRILKDQAIIDALTDSRILLILSVYSRNIAMIFEILILSLALADRIRFIKQKEQEAQEAVIEHLKINEELKDKVNRELESKVDERTQELQKMAQELNDANDQLKEQSEQINKMNEMLDLDNYKLQKKIKEATEARIQLKDVDFAEFSNIFPDDLSCERYLSDIKWADGYECKKCGNEKFCDGNKKYSRRCTKCRYDESVTAYTLLHKCKFPLTKAMYIIMKVNRYGEDISSYELARQLDMRKSTVWSFKQKVLTSLKKQKRKAGASDGDNLAQLILNP